MLRQRLLTAAILLPVFIWCVFALSTQHFALVTAFVVLLGAWEWSALMRLSFAARAAYLALLIAVMLLGAWLITVPLARIVLLAATLLWWVAALVLIGRFQRTGILPAGMRRSDDGEGLHGGWLFGALGMLILVPAWLALVIVHGGLQGSLLVLLLMLLVWGADSGAYVSGRMWGRVRLASRVSPGKTWAGVYGAMVAAVLIAIGAGLWLGLAPFALLALVLLAIVTVLFSIVGDLFESLVKRLAGVKDSGRLLPGHGGVLDRIDSVTAAAPVFVLGLIGQGVLS